MKHERWWCYVIYREGCPCCKVRQLRYGFRLDPVGYMAERDKVAWNTNFTAAERLWILDQCNAITIEE